MSLNQECSSIVLCFGATALRARQPRATVTSLRTHSIALGWRLGGSLFFMSTHTQMGRSSLEQLFGEEAHVERVTRTSQFGWSGRFGHRWNGREAAARSPRKFLGVPRGTLGEEKGVPMRKVSACLPEFRMFHIFPIRFASVARQARTRRKCCVNVC